MAAEKQSNDLEHQNGNAAAETEDWRNRLDAQPNDGEELEEYAGLVKYISTYRDGRRKSSVAAEDDSEAKSAPWYAPWKKAKVDNSEFEIPYEWLDTEMLQGLNENEVLARRKKHGWNELTSESTNLFIQFLSYFTGPILYGKRGSDRNGGLATTADKCT